MELNVVGVYLDVLMVAPSVSASNPLLGFVYKWVVELAGKVDSLSVITFDSEVNSSFPKNVRVYTVKGNNRFSKAISFETEFVRAFRAKRPDVVFCHMYPIYTMLSAPYAKLRGVPIVTWYAHNLVDWKVRVIERLASKVVTSSPGIYGDKIKKSTVLCQGVDTDRFAPAQATGKGMLYVARVSPVKRIEVVINGFAKMVGSGYEDNLTVVGPALDQEYMKELQGLIAELKLDGRVRFIGTVTFSEVQKVQQACELGVNACLSGLDKGVLESMACAKPVLVCNPNFKPVLDIYEDLLFYSGNSAEELAEKAMTLHTDKELSRKVGEYLRTQIQENHSVQALVRKLMAVFEEVTR